MQCHQEFSFLRANVLAILLSENALAHTFVKLSNWANRTIFKEKYSAINSLALAAL